MSKRDRQDAERLEAYGRLGDTHLVHVNPEELGVLRYLKEGPSTYNPATGLEEFVPWGPILKGAVSIGSSLLSGLTGGKETHAQRDAKKAPWIDRAAALQQTQAGYFNTIYPVQAALSNFYMDQLGYGIQDPNISKYDIEKGWGAMHMKTPVPGQNFNAPTGFTKQGNIDYYTSQAGYTGGAGDDPGDLV